MTLASTSDVAVVLAAHGERAGDTPNATLIAHRDALAALQKFKSVSAGVLKGEPTLESALEVAGLAGPGRIAVFPLFMAAGYFTAEVLPKRIAAAGLPGDVTILPPLGLHRGMPLLVHREAVAAAERHGYEPALSSLILVGHGSKFGPASAEATRAAAARIAGLGAFAEVQTAFIEEPPSIADALAICRRPAIVSGFMSGEGLHGGEDIPRAILDSGKAAVFAGVIGCCPDLPVLIATAVSEAMGAR